MRSKGRKKVRDAAASVLWRRQLLKYGKYYVCRYRTSARTGLVLFKYIYPQKMNTVMCPLYELLRLCSLSELMQLINQTGIAITLSTYKISKYNE